jgi:hypothetical protein
MIEYEPTVDSNPSMFRFQNDLTDYSGLMVTASSPALRTPYVVTARIARESMK